MFRKLFVISAVVLSMLTTSCVFNSQLNEQDRLASVSESGKKVTCLVEECAAAEQARNPQKVVEEMQGIICIVCCDTAWYVNTNMVVSAAGKDKAQAGSAPVLKELSGRMQCPYCEKEWSFKVW